MEVVKNLWGNRKVSNYNEIVANLLSRLQYICANKTTKLHSCIVIGISSSKTLVIRVMSKGVDFTLSQRSLFCIIWGNLSDIQFFFKKHVGDRIMQQDIEASALLQSIGKIHFVVNLLRIRSVFEVHKNFYRVKQWSGLQHLIYWIVLAVAWKIYAMKNNFWHCGIFAAHNVQDATATQTGSVQLTVNWQILCVRCMVSKNQTKMLISNGCFLMLLTLCWMRWMIVFLIATVMLCERRRIWNQTMRTCSAKLQR